MSTNPYESTERRNDVSPRTQRRLVSGFVQLVVVLAISAIIVALFFPARRGAREAGRRHACTHNLKQIALGVHEYARVHGRFPPAYTFDEHGNRLHSWRTLILPYIEWRLLFEKIDLTKPWNDPVNREAYETVVDIYRCPSAGVDGTHTVYLAVTAQGGCFEPGESHTFDDITDDQATTLMVVESDREHSVHWMEPADADEAWLGRLRSGTQHWHPGGFNALFVDGHVQFITSDVEASTLCALITIAGGEEVSVR